MLVEPKGATMRRWQLQLEDAAGDIWNVEGLAESESELFDRVSRRCGPQATVLASRSNPDTRPECCPPVLRDDPGALIHLPKNLVW